MRRVNGRRLVGLLVLIAAATLALGREYTIRRDLGYAAMMRDRTAVVEDSVLRTSVAYHAAHAQAVARARWKPYGHGTLGLAGTIAGVAILVSARRRRGRAAIGQ
ncbi:MAG TPA: hypothetical protein VMM18_07335 [Gemmatimonadaceae bacterium]|nr:hypothetical protein [Gemmatimonadaceae bacterium]